AAAAMSDYGDFMTPLRVRRFASQLLAEGVTDAESHKRLLDDLERGQITSGFDLIRYCKHARAFELSKYPAEPAGYLPRIHADVAQLLPNLQFTDFHYEIEIDPETARLPHRQHRVRASFVIGGTRYVQASFIDPDAGPSGKDFGRIDQQEFYQIFNKV